MNTEPLSFEAHKKQVNDVLFTPDGKYLLSAGVDSLVHIWSVPDWEKVKTLRGHSKSVNSLSLTRDGQILVTGSSDKELKAWSLPNNTEIKSFPKTAESASITSNGKYVATEYSNRVQVRSFDKGEIYFTVEEHKRKAHAYNFNVKGTLLATGGLDENILIWEVPSKRGKGEIKAHPKGVMAVAFSPDNSFLASTGYEGALKIWSTQNWGRIQTVEIEGSGMFSLAISPDGETVSVGVNYNVFLIDSETGMVKEQLNVPPKGVHKMNFSQDGQWLALAAADGHIRIWDLT